MTCRNFLQLAEGRGGKYLILACPLLLASQRQTFCVFPSIPGEEELVGLPLFMILFFFLHLFFLFLSFGVFGLSFFPIFDSIQFLFFFLRFFFSLDFLCIIYISFFHLPLLIPFSFLFSIPPFLSFLLHVFPLIFILVSFSFCTLNPLFSFIPFVLFLSFLSFTYLSSSYFPLLSFSPSTSHLFIPVLSFLFFLFPFPW